MKRAPVLALCGVVVLAVVWSLGRTLLEPGDAGARAAAPDLPRQSSTDARASGGEPDRIRGVERGDRASSVAESAQGGERARSALAQRPGARVLRLVAQADGEPVPQAQLLFAPIDHDARIGKHPAWNLAICDDWLGEHGERAECDGQGAARLPLAPGVAFVVVGTAPGLWGRRYVEAEEEGEIALELARDATIQVVTLDGRGAALDGVPVALRKRSSSWQHDALVAHSSAGGRVALRHIGSELTLDREFRWSVAVAAALAEPVEIAIDPEALPVEALVLTVPSTGSLEVLVSALPGGPPADKGRVELYLHDPSSAAGPSFWGRGDMLSAELAGGSALFTHVGLGLEFDVEARAERSTVPTRATGAGPRSPGERARLELALGSDHPVLRMRILDPAGVPAARTGLRAKLRTSSEMGSDTSEDDLSTDEAGLAWYDLSPLWSEEARRVLDLLVEPASEAAAQWLGASAQIDLTRAFPAGTSDVGDVRLRSAGRIASGRVETSDGTPVEGAEVTAEWTARSQALGQDQGWYERLDARSDAQGRFELLGAIEGEMLRLSASSGGQDSARLECRAGASDLVLTLLEGARVEGRLLLDEAISSDALRVALHVPEDQAEFAGAPRSSSAVVSSDGHFALTNVATGTYDLDVNANHRGSRVAHLEGLWVPPAGPCSDPRLEAIDLRGALIAFTLELVPPRPDDRLLGIVTAELIGAAADVEARTTNFLHGSNASFVLPCRSVDLEIHMDGFRAVRLSDVRRDVRVELEPGLRVRLRLRGDDPLPRPPRYLKPFLSAEEDPPGSQGHFQTSVIDESREVVLSAESAGSLYVHWLLEIRAEHSLTTTSMQEDVLQKIEVQDVPGEQNFEIAFPKAVLDALSKAGDG